MSRARAEPIATRWKFSIPQNLPGKPFIRSEAGDVGRCAAVSILRGRGPTLSATIRAPGPVFPFRPDQSFLPNLDPSARQAGDSTRGFQRFHVQALALAVESIRYSDCFPDRTSFSWRATVSNLASFYSYLNSERPDERSELERRLSDALPGFRYFRFERLGDQKLLLAEFDVEGKPALKYNLRELSEGQRVLAVLYAAVCGLAHPGAMLCFDEPDNFVSLSEIQPWLQFLRDALEEQDAQAIIISHHPEVMDYLALDSLWWFDTALWACDRQAVRDRCRISPEAFRARRSGSCVSLPRKLRCWLLCEDREQERLFRPDPRAPFPVAFGWSPGRPTAAPASCLQQVEASRPIHPTQPPGSGGHCWS